jgi:Phosphotransferase enzyme family
LHTPVERCLFYTSSQGAVFGLELEDQRRLVLKAHQPDRSAPFLSAVHEVQRHLAENGFPCPTPILGPRPLGGGLAVTDELLTKGDHVDAHVPAVRREMARALSWLVRLAKRFTSSQDLPRASLMHLRPGSLWRSPHHRIFDFEATRGGAEWIDSIAATALRELMSSLGEVVVGHTDWSVKDFRFSDGRITAIYDWDSLAVEKEPIIVGQAATHFPTTWHLPVPVAPTADEVSAFVADYEEARGRALSVAERNAIAAAGRYSMAYTARCEHALDPTAKDYAAGSARGFLAELNR